MASNSFRFATRVWLTSVLLSPFLFFVLNGSVNTKELHLELVGIGGFILLSIVFGLLFSLPCWILLIFIVKFVNKQFATTIVKKSVIIFIGLLLTCLLFYLIYYRDIEDHDDLKSITLLAINYCLTIAGGILVFKLREDNNIKAS